MTKEMRPAHRVDVLTDALLHYCRLSSNNLSILIAKNTSMTRRAILEHLLPLRKRRAIQERDTAAKELRELIEQSPGMLKVCC